MLVRYLSIACVYTQNRENVQNLHFELVNLYIERASICNDENDDDDDDSDGNIDNDNSSDDNEVFVK